MLRTRAFQPYHQILYMSKHVEAVEAHCVQNKLHSMVHMSKQSIHCMQNKLFSIRNTNHKLNPIYVEAVEACRSSRYIVYEAMKLHCVQNKLDSMFLPITFLIFNGFSIRKKFWNAENQGFPTIPPNPIYVEAVEVYKINYIQWYARRSSRYIVCKIKTTFNSMHVEAVDTLCTK